MRPEYHPYWIREEFLNGLFNTTCDEPVLIKKVIRLFNSESRTRQQMNNIISNWPYSTEHNLTNTSKNRVAWLGQAACCYAFKAPDYITKKAWWSVKKENRDKADKIAQTIIQEYEKKIRGECITGGARENQVYF